METTITERANIEDLLNQIQRIREITGDKKDKNYQGVTGDAEKELDQEICLKIYEIIFKEEAVADLEVTKKFFAWLSMLNRDFSKKIFTTNYDLIKPVDPERVVCYFLKCMSHHVKYMQTQRNKYK